MKGQWILITDIYRNKPKRLTFNIIQLSDMPSLVKQVRNKGPNKALITPRTRNRNLTLPMMRRLGQTD